MDVSLSHRIHREGGFERLSVKFRCEEGTWTGLAGPSGCGKTTVLRMIAGLEKPQTGYVHADGKLWFSHDDKIWLSVHQRRCGFIFQKPALFPHLTVLQNIEYGCADKALPVELLDRAALRELAHRQVSVLSGGQQQRVALLRALAARPRVLLLDEPFSALDETRQAECKELLIHFFERERFTVLIVSHDLPDLRGICETIIHVDSGAVEKRQ